jgi:hypothetical protein
VTVAETIYTYRAGKVANTIAVAALDLLSSEFGMIPLALIASSTPGPGLGYTGCFAANSKPGGI